MPKKLYLIHGRSFKPTKTILTNSWFAALRHGIARDYGAQMALRFDRVPKELIYYGDLSNKKLGGEFGKPYDKTADTRDRKKTLKALMEYGTEDFLGSQGKKLYSDLPGKTAAKEFFADAFSGLFHHVNASEYLIKKVAQDMRDYWLSDSTYGSDVRWRLTQPLARSLAERDDIMLISHSLGTMIAYDTLWKFSHYGEYQDIRHRKLTHWLTLGSPLGNETVRENLKGSSARNERRYPHNIGAWSNFAAEDDYISHDQTLADDFSAMKSVGLLGDVRDHRIYNLSVRFGKSNPHHGVGYLIHPAVSQTVAEWL